MLIEPVQPDGWSIVMRATLNDIAKRVGVSKSLVSMYLNNHKLSSKIAAETKSRIDVAVKELDYRPSFTARALSNGKTRTIGIVCGGIKNPYFANLVEDALDEAAKHGYQLILGLTRRIPEEEEKTVKNLLNRQIDGLICCIHPEENSKTYTMFRQSRIPIIRLSPSKDFPTVCADGNEAMEKAVAFLAERGHSRICGVFYEHSEWPEPFVEACKKAHVDSRLLPQNDSETDQYVKSFIRQKETALIVNGAPPLLAALERHPDYRPDLIVGYDDYTMYSSLDRISGGIYTDSCEQIRIAVDLLINSLEHPSQAIPGKTGVHSLFLSRKEIEARQNQSFGVLTPFPIYRKEQEKK